MNEDFVRSLLDIQKNDKPQNSDEKDDASAVGCAIAVGLRAGVAAREKILGMVTPLMEKGDYFEATVALFTAVWSNIEWARKNTEKTEGVVGTENPVSQLWEIFQTAMMANGPEAAHAALEKWKRENGLGGSE